MKIFLFLLLLPLIGFSNMNDTIHDLGYQIASDLDKIVDDEGIKDIIVKRKIRKRVRRHIRNNQHEYVAIINEMLYDTSPASTIEELLAKIFGEDLASIIMDLTAIPAVEGRRSPGWRGASLPTK